LLSSCFRPCKPGNKSPLGCTLPCGCTGPATLHIQSATDEYSLLERALADDIGCALSLEMADAINRSLFDAYDSIVHSIDRQDKIPKIQAAVKLAFTG
jgi:hypothetical protein